MDPNATLKAIIENLFHCGGDYAAALELIEALAEWLINDGFEPNADYSWDWSDILAGAYWHCVHNAVGQKSDEYRLQCIISKLYKPSPLATGPECGSSEDDIYNALTELSFE